MIALRYAPTPIKRLLIKKYKSENKGGGGSRNIIEGRHYKT